MRIKKVLSLLLSALLLCSFAAAEMAFEPLPMDKVVAGPEPKNENYISDMEYADDSITVKLYEGRYADTDYVYAHVKIVHPSQLRTAPAQIANKNVKDARFRANSTAEARGRDMAAGANAVISINGDFFRMSQCTSVLRMSTQIRNAPGGYRDLLIIDKNGDFSYLNKPMKNDYAAYYEANKENMYQVFCFGPVLVENGVSVITEEYLNKYIGSQNNTQRSAICQLGPLEYMLVTCYGNQTRGNKGLTIYEFAQVCEMIGKELNPEGGCKLAFNLDGGNSSTMNFKRLDPKDKKWKYVKVNCPEIERKLSDIIYFATLEK